MITELSLGVPQVRVDVVAVEIRGAGVNVGAGAGAGAETAGTSIGTDEGVGVDTGKSAAVGVGASAGNGTGGGVRARRESRSDNIAGVSANVVSDGASKGAVTDDTDPSCAEGRWNAEISTGTGSGMGSLGYNQGTD